MKLNVANDLSTKHNVPFQFDIPSI